eukprot:CFRG1520T1
MKGAEGSLELAPDRSFDNEYLKNSSECNGRADSGYTSTIASPDPHCNSIATRQHIQDITLPKERSAESSHQTQQQRSSTDFRRHSTKEEDISGMNSLMALASVAAAEATSLSQKSIDDTRKSKYDSPLQHMQSTYPPSGARPPHLPDHQAMYDKYERSAWMFSETGSNKSEEGSFYDYVPGDFTEFGEKKGVKRRERNREAALLCRKKKKETLTQIRDSVTELSKQNQDITNLVSTVAKDVLTLQTVTNNIEISNKELELELERLSCQYAMAQRIAMAQAEQGNASMLQELTKVTTAINASSITRDSLSNESSRNPLHQKSNHQNSHHEQDQSAAAHGHIHNLSCRVTCRGDQITTSPATVAHYA